MIKIDHHYFKSVTDISNLPLTQINIEVNFHDFSGPKHLTHEWLCVMLVSQLFFHLHDIEIFLAGILIIKLTKRRCINRNGIGSVRVCPDDLIRRGVGRGQYCYEVDR